VHDLLQDACVVPLDSQGFRDAEAQAPARRTVVGAAADEASRWW